MFEQFIAADVRRTRQHLPVTEESVTKKLTAMLPEWLVRGNVILDLGCATGSAGHWCSNIPCRHYTGVELQDNYYQTAKSLLPDREIIQADAIEFMRKTDRQWEVVVAAGLLHGIYDPFEAVRLLDKVATDYIVIENNETVENGVPTIQFRKTNMVNDEDMSKPYHGYATYVGSSALEFMMNELGWVGDRIYPEKLSSGLDPYHTMTKFQDDIPEHVHRYIYIFRRSDAKPKSLEQVVRSANVEV